MNHSSVSKHDVKLSDVDNRKPSKWKGRLKEVAIWVAVAIFTIAYSAIVPSL